MKIPTIIDRLELEQEIEQMAVHYEEKMTPELRLLRRRIINDLYNGPVYLNNENEECCLFDENAKQFDFKSACNEIKDWLDENVNDIKYEYSFDDETGESEWESVEDSNEQIKKIILGVAYQYLY